MTGTASWSRLGDDDWDAEIQRCVREGNKINIIFANRKDDSEGQISFDAKTGQQEVIAKWIFNTKTSESYCATVRGKLTKFAKQVTFEGLWDERDGEPWEFEIEASLD